MPKPALSRVVFLSVLPQENLVRLKAAAFVGLAALLVGIGLTACGDPNRSSYVRYTPAPFATTPSATAT